jgi:hypothetical protein
MPSAARRALTVMKIRINDPTVQKTERTSWVCAVRYAAK